jgi:FlaA1/EpsC-like NDP-sugar epimerase
LKHRFQDHPYQIVGFIDDDPRKQHLYVEGCPVLGTRSDLVRVADTYSVDLIVVALHNISGTDFREILTLCEQTKARIKVVPT